MLLLKSSRYFFFAPHALAREPNLQKTWKLECPSALPCSIFSQNLTKIVQSVQLLCKSLEIEAIKRPMRTSIHFIHCPVLIKYCTLISYCKAGRFPKKTSFILYLKWNFVRGSWSSSFLLYLPTYLQYYSTETFWKFFPTISLTLSRSLQRIDF